MPMTRSIFAVSFVLSAILVTAGQGCKQGGVGDPCTPEQEFDPTFSGFSIKEVNIESKSFQCQTRLCLVNHYRGRTSCPTGQDANGVGLNPSDPKSTAKPEACLVPGTTTKVTGPTGASLNPRKKACVPSQCSKRKKENAVYCSCRCANSQGQTNDGAIYCGCPDGFTCSKLVSSTGRGNEGLTGSYCIKNATEYDPAGDPCGDKEGANDRCED